MEVIVVNNGSTDGDLESVCQGFEKVCFAREEKVGLHPARNKGLGLAKGVGWVQQTENCSIVVGHVAVFLRKVTPIGGQALRHDALFSAGALYQE